MPASRRHECIQTLEPFGYEFPDVGVKSASDDEFTRTLAVFADAGIGFIRDQELTEPDINCLRSMNASGRSWIVTTCRNPRCT